MVIFYKKWKKYNELQLTKNKVDLNIWKIANHPPSHVQSITWVPHCNVQHNTLQSALESGQEARIVQIDFSAAFDRVNHQGILYKISSVGIGGSVSSVLTQFLSNRSQYVLVDGCRSKLVNVLSGVPQGSVWGQLFFLLYTSELFFHSGEQTNLLCWRLHFDSCAIPKRSSYSSRVPEPWLRQSECVMWP